MPPSDVPPPAVPSPEGWRVVSEEVTTPFDARIVAVRAHTVVVADESLRDRVRARTGADAAWRFFFASRLRLRPAAPPSRAVSKLVANRATAGFADVLRERGLDSVRAVSSRRLSVRDETADLTRYRACVAVAGEDPSARRRSLDGGDCPDSPDWAVAVDGYVAVWPDDGGFLLAGGAYPRGVASGPDELTACFDPEGFREELFEMIRATR